jgi:thioredoxin 1
MAKEFNEAQVHDNIKGDKLFLVDFFTPTCSPCRKLAPTVEKLAEEYKDTATIGKCDVSENMDLAAEFHISAVPTLIFFKSGKEVERKQGVMSEQDLRALVEKHK